MRIMQIFKEASGNYSATRFVFIVVSVTIALTWCYTSIRAGAMQPISMETTALIGVLQTGKVFQKKDEVKSEPTPVG